MSALLDVDRTWSPEDIASLPGDLDWRRVEIVDGMLVVSPLPSKRHLLIADRLFALLTRAAPATLHVTGSAAPVEFGRTYRVPDVAVLRRTALASPGATFRPDDLVLAVEVESPSSITTDRITKPAQYAEGGIQHYWRVEPDPLTLTTYALVDGTYVETGSWGPSDSARIDDPFPITIDLRTLRQ